MFVCSAATGISNESLTAIKYSNVVTSFGEEQLMMSLRDSANLR